jgi:hypothetical protein
MSFWILWTKKRYAKWIENRGKRFSEECLFSTKEEALTGCIFGIFFLIN